MYMTALIRPLDVKKSNTCEITDRKHIEQNFYSVAGVMPPGGTWGCWGVKNFSMGICDGAPSTAHSSLF